MIEILVGCSQNCKLPSLKFHLYTYLYTVSVMGDSMIYSSSLRATCCITKKQLSIVSFTSIYTKVPLQVRPLEVGISANCYTMCCRISVHVCMYIIYMISYVRICMVYYIHYFTMHYIYTYIRIIFCYTECYIYVDAPASGIVVSGCGYSDRLERFLCSSELICIN